MGVVELSVARAPSLGKTHPIPGQLSQRIHFLKRIYPHMWLKANFVNIANLASACTTTTNCTCNMYHYFVQHNAHFGGGFLFCFLV